MTAYQHDDGAEMIEVRPGQWVRRDVALAMKLAIPAITVSGRATGFASAAPDAPEPVEPPPLQPSHEDLVAVAPQPAGAAQAVRPAKVRAPRPRPAKRPLSAILADAARTQRARRPAVKA